MAVLERVAAGCVGALLTTPLGCGRLDYALLPAVDGGTSAGLRCPDAGCSVASGWVQTFGTSGADFGFGTAIDATQVYLTGFYAAGPLDFGGGPLPAPGIHDIMIAGFDHDGGEVFSQRQGGSGFNEGFAVATGPGGAIYATGHIEGDADFGGGLRTAFGGNDAYFLGLDQAGNHRYSVLVGGTAQDDGRMIAADAAGNAYFVGWFNEQAQFPDRTETTNGARDTFIVSLDPAGNHRWTVTFGGAGDDVTRGIAVVGDTVAVAGEHRGSFSIDGQDVGFASGVDGHIIAFDTATGTYRWHVELAGDADEGVVRIAPSQGGFVAGGYFTGGLNLGGETFTSRGGEDIAVVEVSVNGAVQWTHQSGGGGDQRFINITSGPRGEIVGIGISTGAFTFAGEPVANAGDRDILIAAFAPDGTELWARSYGSADFDEGHAVAIDDRSRVFAVGCFNGDIVLADEPVSSEGSCDTFMLRLDPTYDGP